MRTGPTRGLVRCSGRWKGRAPARLLYEDRLGSGTLVAHARAPRRTAADGRGRNGPHRAGLPSHPEQPLEIRLLFGRRRAQVPSSKNGQPRPYEYQPLLTEHYRSMPPTAPSVTLEPTVPGAASTDVGQLDVAQLRARERYEDGRGVAQDTE